MAQSRQLVENFLPLETGQTLQLQCRGWPGLDLAPSELRHPRRAFGHCFFFAAQSLMTSSRWSTRS